MYNVRCYAAKFSMERNRKKINEWNSHLLNLWLQANHVFGNWSSHTLKPEQWNFLNKFSVGFTPFYATILPKSWCRQTKETKCMYMVPFSLLISEIFGSIFHSTNIFIVKSVHKLIYAEIDQLDTTTKIKHIFRFHFILLESNKENIYTNIQLFSSHLHPTINEWYYNRNKLRTPKTCESHINY